MKALCRPDTLYLFSFARWKPEIAEAINAARAQAAGPKGLGLQHRIDRVLSEVDPQTAEHLRRLPFDELLREVQNYERSQDAEFAIDGEAPPAVTLELAGEVFQVVPYSPRRGCTVQLIGSWGTVHLRTSSPKPNAPNCYVEIGSIALWSSPSWQSLCTAWQAWLDDLTQMRDPWHVTRVDAAYHVQGLKPEHLDRSRYTCRAETHRLYTKERILARLEAAYQMDEHARKTGHEATNVAKLIDELHAETGMVVCDWFKDGVPQMIGFGSRGRIYCRMYNKTIEVMRSPVKRALFESIWNAAGFAADEHTYNVEFEMCRAWLNTKEFIAEGRTFRIDTLQDLLQNWSALQTYLVGNEQTKTQGWLRMHDQNHTRAERCTTHEIWQTIREAAAILPELRTTTHKAAKVRQTAANTIKQAVRLKARLDSYLGREFNEDDVSVEQMMASIAEVMCSELTRERDSWSEHEMTELYRAERAKMDLAPFNPGRKSFRAFTAA